MNSFKRKVTKLNHVDLMFLFSLIPLQKYLIVTRQVIIEPLECH